MAASGHIIPAVLNADSVPVDLGRAQRYANDAQWLALMLRDGGCVLCDAPLGTLDAHHTPHWCQGGTTDTPRAGPDASTPGSPVRNARTPAA